MKVDQSILNHSVQTNGGQTINEYANECIKAVCLNGESLSKYQRMIEKQFGADFYQKCNTFVNEVKRSVGRKKFTNTSIANLELLAKEINIPVDTVNIVCKHFTEQFAKAERHDINNPQPNPYPQHPYPHVPPEKKKSVGWYTFVVVFVLSGLFLGAYVDSIDGYSDNNAAIGSVIGLVVSIVITRFLNYLIYK